MDDFLAGGEFSSGAGTGGDIDFDKAASAFPDISLDGEGDFPAASVRVKPFLQTGLNSTKLSYRPMQPARDRLAASRSTILTRGKQT